MFLCEYCLCAFELERFNVKLDAVQTIICRFMGFSILINGIITKVINKNRNDCSIKHLLHNYLKCASVSLLFMILALYTASYFEIPFLKSI